MKARLLYRDRDVDFTIARVRYPKWWEVQGLPISEHSESLLQDLELGRVLAAMASGDSILREISKRVVLASIDDPDAIYYRQHVLADCMRNEQVVRQMLAIASTAVVEERQVPGWFTSSPDGVLRHGLEVLKLCVGLLRQLRGIADEHGDSFTSEGFSTLFAALKAELDDEYFQLVEGHLKRLRFEAGVPISARFGPGLKPSEFVLRLQRDIRLPFKERLGVGPRSECHWDLPPRDQAGSRALTELHNKAVTLVADAVGQSASHITSFFTMLWIELGFYTACLNLADALRQRGRPTCFPQPEPPRPRRLGFAQLCDASLALEDGVVVGNEAGGDGKDLVLITGANSGGKSTFLRSLGLAQVMMQAGMFVCAESYTASTTRRIFTHFIREEDPSMSSGKLDEELARMSRIADQLTVDSIVLFNESFAATNEREGSEIASQIVRALLDSGVTTCFVTHQYTLARRLYGQLKDQGLFLRADRQPDGSRTFKLVEGEPLRTSFGEDIYRKIGGWGDPPIGSGRQSRGADGRGNRSGPAEATRTPPGGPGDDPRAPASTRPDGPRDRAGQWHPLV
jgi:MutS domain V